MSDKVKVRVYIVGTWEISRTVELSASDHAELFSRWAEGSDRDVASDLIDAAKLTFRDGDIDDLRIEEFEDVP